MEDENPFDGHGLEEAVRVETLMGWDDPPRDCATCGQPLGADPEDEPHGDAGRPICGECNRARNFDPLGRDGGR